jgi:ribonuclease R
MNITEHQIHHLLSSVDPEGLTLKELLLALNQRAHKRNQLRKALKKLSQKGLCRKIDDRYYSQGQLPKKKTRRPASDGREMGPKRSPGAFQDDLQGVFVCENGCPQLIALPEGRRFPLKPADAEGLMHGDRVRFRRDPLRNPSEVQLDGLIRRGITMLRGQIKPDKHGTVSFIADSPLFPHRFKVEGGRLRGHNTPRPVLLEITRYPDRQRPGTGRLDGFFGADLEGRHLIAAILSEHAIRTAFPDKVRAAGNRLPGAVRLDRREDRTDLRHLPFVTIDGEDARDFDDAIFLRPDGDGFRLWVSIADVAAYVREGSELDREAAARGTSIYLPQAVYPMLPEGLSNGLCSLKEGVNRRTLTCEVQLSGSGRPVACSVYRSLIKTACRLTYRQVDDFFETGTLRPRKAFPELDRFLTLCREVASLLERKRTARGALRFSLPETRFVYDRQGRIVDCIKWFQSDGEKVIEQLMLEANEAIARFCEKNRIPILWRNHPPPLTEKLLDLQQLFWQFGLTIPELGKGREINRALRRLKTHPQRELLEYSLLRSLTLAVYENRRQGHFGLAATHYCHFTSPIRRYPDLLVHRAISAYLDGKPARHIAATTGVAASEREQAATAAERAVVKLTKLRMLTSAIGAVMMVVVTGYHRRGLFVELNGPYAEGFVAFESIIDDHYDYDEAQHLVIARHHRRIIAVGTRLQAILTRLDRRYLSAELEWLGWVEDRSDG